MGVLVAALALVVMPLLARAKLRVGEAMGRIVGLVRCFRRKTR